MDTHDCETFTEDGDLFDGPSNKEEFRDINIMISRWEAQEEEEKTPVLEMVRVKRRRSAKLDRLVRERCPWSQWMIPK